MQVHTIQKWQRLHKIIDRSSDTKGNNQDPQLKFWKVRTL
jgi:hypothetical protein